MLPFVVRFHLIGSVLGLLLLAVLGLGVGALSHALAIACRKNHETFYAVQQTLLFPLLFLSGLMLPLELAPRWMALAASANPITYIADATRALFNGQVFVAEVGRGAVVVIGLAAVGLALGARGMRRAQP
jgi:ABC-2 type transport system permease protein